MKMTIPDLCLVALIGATGSGKSHFASRHFRPTEVVSSDACRAMVADDATDQAATPDAFEVLNFIAAKRLRAGRLTVIDATSVQRSFGRHVVRRQVEQLKRSMGRLKREGFRYVFVLDSAEEAEGATIERVPLWTNLGHEHGLFDIIGDVHGCFDELATLLERLEYRLEVRAEASGETRFSVTHPQGRKAVFVGDLVDRGPDVPNVLRLVMSMTADGAGHCVAGNHDSKLLRKLQGRNVQVSHGLAESLAQLEVESEEFRQEVARFLDGLISHYVLDDGKLVVAHAGIREEYQGRASARVRDFCLYGETTGETDEFGLPIRSNWAVDYRGAATVVYGHTAVVEPVWLNRTINIDTGCVFGGRLTALRYPEKELISVPAGRTYYAPVRPLANPAEPLETSAPDRARSSHLLDIDDVTGKRVVSTRLRGNITVREENAAAALEVMSRFAMDPRWLVYLPPTISPCETSGLPGLLEHPAEVFTYFRNNGVSRVVCEEKHMGSRAVVVIGQDAAAIEKRFGATGGDMGACYTRTGRRFFEDRALEAEFLEGVREGISNAGLWEELETDWVVLDSELMPWSFKAQELLSDQYAPVGTAARSSLGLAESLLRQASERGVNATDPLAKVQERLGLAQLYCGSYARYCWPVQSLADIQVAPFHVLASEGRFTVTRTTCGTWTWPLACMNPVRPCSGIPCTGLCN